MNALVHFNKHLRRLFDHPSFEDFGLDHPLERVMQESRSDYSVFKHHEEGAWFVELPVPGMTQEQIKVEVDPKERKLKVIAQKKEDQLQKKETITWTRRAQMDRVYSFDLDENLDIQSIEANCEHGILTLKIKEISLQKPEEALRQIEVGGPKA